MLYTISLGSNEQRHENLEWARRRLKEMFPDIDFSTEQDTEPMAVSRPVPFANQMARFHSDMPCQQVAACLKAVEREAGRKPDDVRSEIVRLDVDLLMCDGEVCKPQDMERGYVQSGLKELNEKQCKNEIG